MIMYFFQVLNQKSNIYLKVIELNWIIIYMFFFFIYWNEFLFSFGGSIVFELLFFVVKWKCIHGNWKWKVQNELEMCSCFLQYNESEFSFKLCVIIFWVHSQLEYHNKNRDTFLSNVLSFEIRI
jgi:hypothetical protein